VKPSGGSDSVVRLPAATEAPQSLEIALDAPTGRAVASGARSGILLGVASAVGIVANYGFLLAAGRLLGTGAYGSLAALLGLLTLVLFPASALQMAVSREVSHRLAAAGDHEADAFTHAVLRLAARATVPVLAAGLVLSYPLALVLHIRPAGLVAIAAVSLAVAFVSPVAMGVLQGRQRFHALAGMYVFPFVVRLALLGVVAGAGYRLGGTVVATVAAALASGVGALALIRDAWVEPERAQEPALGTFVRYLVPVVVGLVGIAVLTNVDVLVVKARFGAHEAGAYGAASAFARVAFFLPATILAVLFPRTAARQARGEETRDILGRSLIVTAAFCGLLALFYLPTGRGLIVTSFGADFAQGGHLLAPYALAIGLYSLAYVLAGYHLSRNETRYAWIVGAAVAVQIVVLSVVPGPLIDVVWANLGVAAALVAAHELAVESSFPAIRAGVGMFWSRTVALRRPFVREGLPVLAITSAFVCALFWPLVTGLGSTVVGPGSDASGAIGWLWSLQHEGGYHLFGSVHHTVTSAPVGWTGGNGANIQWLLPYYAAYLATKVVGATAAYNLVVLTGYVLSGVSMYVLARYLRCSPLVAGWAALAYIVFPWHLARTPHGSLIHLEFLPLLLLTLVAAARRPSWLRFGLVGAVTLVTWLTSGYLGAMAVVAAGFFALFVAFTTARRRAAIVLAGAAAAAVLPSLFVALLSIVSGFGRGAGLQRAAGDLSIYGLRPLELFVPSRGNFVLGGRLTHFLIAHQHGSNQTETSNYAGFLTIALVLGWLVVAWRGRRRLSGRLQTATVGLVGVAVGALLLAAPSPILVAGHRIWMPSRLLWEVVPAVRVPSRWDALLMTALVPLAALGLQAAWSRFGRGGRRLVPLALVGAAMVFSFLELSINPDRPRFSTSPLPAEYAAVRETPSGILAEYPLGESSDYYFWQHIHGRPILNGPTGWPGDEIRGVLVDPSVPGTADQLALLGVTTIVTHANALSYVSGVPDRPNATWGPGYRLVARNPSDGSSLWDVVAQPAPALAMFRGGFGKAEAPSGTFVAYPLDASSGVGAIELWAPRAAVVRLTIGAAPPHGSTKTLAVTDTHVERSFALTGHTTVSFTVQVPAGHSVLLLKSNPAATSDADALVVSAPDVQPARGTADYSGQSIPADPGWPASFR
jgi:O-antigen/teichoic acid export membrane protein